MSFAGARVEIWRGAAASAALLVLIGAWELSDPPVKRFGVVAPGRLYRSGEFTPRQLERLVRERRLGRVLSLLDGDAPQSQAERRVAERLGVEWVNVPLHGDGSSDAAARRRIVEMLCDPNAPPTLVHCAAGVNRTGLAVGLYRINNDGWEYDRVLEELLAFNFENLPKHENLRAALREADARRGESGR